MLIDIVASYIAIIVTLSFMFVNVLQADNVARDDQVCMHVDLWASITPICMILPLASPSSSSVV